MKVRRTHADACILTRSIHEYFKLLMINLKVMVSVVYFVKSARPLYINKYLKDHAAPI